LFKTYPIFSLTLSYQSLLKAEILMKHISIVLTRHQKVNDNRKLMDRLRLAPFLVLLSVGLFYSPLSSYQFVRWSSFLSVFFCSWPTPPKISINHSLSLSRDNFSFVFCIARALSNMTKYKKDPWLTFENAQDEARFAADHECCAKSKR
jgi:hypothetical protein